MGRPTVRTSDLADDLCEFISTGGTLIDWCEIQGNPSHTTILRWLRTDDSFSSQYARAREDQADYFADEIKKIARECEADTAQIAKATLEINTNKWLAGKRKPKVYGEKSNVDLTSGGKPIESLTDEERAARTLAILDEARARRTGQAPTD